ncbi:integrase [Hypericibacter terrae]|uniref:Integrase n=1 Tax=Hypericibacter terrae TaxID=2602015 RepID=A0A5J6MLM9_9PROT|nr:site-specific integrase [Hypericibacter terrae]QEX18037.1 integrase [Hypericibacter terrae]
MLPQCSHSGSHDNGDGEGSHVTKKRGVYYYRRRLPSPHGGEIALSLGTTNYREAEHQAAILDKAFNELMQTMTTNTTKPTADLQAIVRDYLKTALQADFEQHLSTKAGEPVYQLVTFSGEDPIDADLSIIDHLIGETAEALARRDVRSVAATVDRLLAKHELPAEQRPVLALSVLQAQLKVLETARQRILGQHPELALDDTSRQLAPAPEPSAVPGPSLREAGPLLSAALPNFIDYMVTEEGWRGQTKAQSETTFRLFVEWCGDKPLQAYTRKDTAGFFDMLRKLPALYSKDKRWRDLSLPEIITQSQGIEVERLTMKTVKRHFSALGRLFDYAKKRDQYIGENPAHGFDFPTKGRGKGKARKVWAGEPLRKLFASPVWTGCHPSFRAQPGDKIIRDDKFWLPILGLYHGNRLEEFAQLRREDVKREGDIWFFDIHDQGGRQVKNDQSIRRVPLHPVLVHLGFQAYLDEVAPNPTDRVFPELKPGGPDNKVGYYFTKWWTNYRRAIGVYEKGLDYHSFRHGVTTKLFAAGVPREVVDELTGHEGEGTSQTVYLHEFPLRVLADAIAKVEWPEVSFKP